MSSYANWSNEDDETLIHFVRNHEPIYNVKSKQYRKAQMKQKWWREVGELLNKADTDCCKRWCYIRDYYVRRRAKPCTGTSRETTKRAELLSFLDNFPSSQKSNFTNDADENSCDNSDIIENTHDDNERVQTPAVGTIKMENINNTEETQSNFQEIEVFLCENNYHENDNEVKSDNKRKHSDVSQGSFNHQQIAISNSTQNGLDENDLFFASMAKIVKKLSPYDQVSLRLHIGSLVGNAEIRHLSEKRNYITHNE